MPLSVDREENRWLIRVEGEFGMSAAAEMKALLLEGLASSKELRVDLERAEAIDIPLLQMLWAGAREAGPRDGGIVCGVPEAAARAAREAGFERFPGVGVQE